MTKRKDLTPEVVNQARGRYARAKGGREERYLVKTLLSFGFTDARRGLGFEQIMDFRPDVVANYGAVPYMFENKSTSSKKYGWLYEHLDNEGIGYNDTLSVYEHTSDTCIAISYNPTNLIDVATKTFLAEGTPSKFIKKLITLKKLKRLADIIVFRANHKKPIFIRYWPK